MTASTRPRARLPCRLESTSTAGCSRSPERQHGLVARDQLREFGTRAPDRVPARPADGSSTSTKACTALAGSPRTWHQQLLAACLASSGANAVSFRAGRAAVGPARRRRDRRGDGAAASPHAVRRRHDARELLPHRPRRHLPARHPGHPAGTRHLRPRAARRSAASCGPSELDARAAGRDPARPRRPPARVARVATARRRPATGRPRHRSAARQLPAADAQARQHAGAQAARCCSAPRGFPSRSRSTASRSRRRRSARLDYAWPEAKVYCEFDPYKWHGDRDKYMRDNRPSASTRRPRLVRRVRHRRRARFRRAACNTRSSADTSPAPDSRAGSVMRLTPTQRVGRRRTTGSRQRCLPARRARFSCLATAWSIRRSSNSL